MKPVRCAIYTRKSSEEGLEQSFNSLDAQREACSAYILSQASAGWIEVDELYDDGGLSGGTLERPALQRLLAAVRGGQIDIIVVYKVDRLTRSLFDFAKLVEELDAAGTSFVSVTQSFNTTTSMGRLTLNMLLSFAQFEREVTAERIRDKIAASKAKGMWMGGIPPIGYRADGRTLAIVEPEAVQVRDIFGRYLRLGNVTLVAAELIRDGVRTPHRINSRGRAFGGCSWSRGQIYKLLSNVLYIGMIEHRGQRHLGLHAALIDVETWEATQQKLADNLQGGIRRRASHPSHLAGRIVDADGQPLVAVHATKGRARYRYYVSRALQRGVSSEGLRIPAREIETLVADRVAQFFNDPIAMIGSPWLDANFSRLPRLQQRSVEIGSHVKSNRALLEGLVSEVRIFGSKIEIRVSTAAAAAALDEKCRDNVTGDIVLESEVRLTRSGRAVRLVDTQGVSPAASPEKSLLRLVVQARLWWTELKKGEFTVSSLAVREGVTRSYMTRVVRLAFLSPQVVDAMLIGRQRSGLSATALTQGDDWPADWEGQARVILGIPA